MADFATGSGKVKGSIAARLRRLLKDHHVLPKAHYPHNLVTLPDGLVQFFLDG